MELEIKELVQCIQQDKPLAEYVGIIESLYVLQSPYLSTDRSW